MIIRFPSSSHEPVELNIPPDKLVAEWNPPSPSSSLSQVLRDAIAAPVGYPPLSQAILPGDHVTIALDPELPQPDAVAAELVAQFVRAGCQESGLTVLVSMSQRIDSLPAEVAVVVHDPADETTHAYLAATRDGRPVYLNRAIGDADVFIPVGVQRLDDSLDDRGIHSGWFPAYSNLETQLRHQSPGNVEWQVHRKRRRQETDEAAWLLGARLVVQVLPGPGDSIAAAWCGDAEEVDPLAQRAGRELWLQEIDRPAELVIASIDGDLSWRQVARALQMAARAVTDGGAIVLWTNLADDPGPALKSLADFETSEEEQRLALLKQRSADATAAKVFADCRERCHVYLHSRLEDAVIEDIGLVPLRDAAQLQRLIDHAASCLVIGSAQHAGVHLRQGVEA